MAFVKLLMLSLVNLPIITHAKAKNGSCKDLVRELGSSNSHFLQCATNNGAPVTLCISCVESYKEVEAAYEKFLHGNENSLFCPDIYVDKDKLNIIAHTQDIIKNLWAEAYCKNCYNPDGTMSDDAAKFEKYCINFAACLIQNLDDFCPYCKHEYDELNNEFNALEEKYKNQVCFDIQDKMNRTRGNWTDSCGHETPNASLLAFAAVTSSLMSIPVMFYLGFFLFTRRQERNHQILDLMPESEPENSMATTSREALNIPSTSNGITENHTESNTNSKTKLLDLDDDEDLLQ